MIEQSVVKALESVNDNLQKEDKVDTDYLTIKQASAFLHIAVATLYDYTHKKKIPFNKVGKKLLFSKRELSEWVLTHKRRTKKEIDTETDNWLLKQQS